MNPWVVYYQSDDDWFPPFIDYYFGYKIQGDIEIEGTWYKKVYYRSYIPVNNNGGLAYPPVYIGEEYLYGAIRDDIPNKRVYGIQFCDITPVNSCTCNEEFLMYDFNMDIGDYLTDFCLVLDNDFIFVESISDIYVFDKMRKLISLDREIYGTSIDFLEGFGSYSPDSGSLFGLFNTSGEMFGCPCTDLELYCIGKDEECLNGFLLLNQEWSIKNTVTFYPNPVTNQLNIISDKEPILSVRVFNVLGEKLLTHTSNPFKLNLIHLQKGIYFVEITSTKGKTIKKIIKE